MRIAARIPHLPIPLRVSHTSRTILARNLAISRSVADGRELRPHARRVGSRRGLGITLLAIDRIGLGILTVTFLGSLAGVLFLLLPGLPFFADFLEFCDDVSDEVSDDDRWVKLR